MSDRGWDRVPPPTGPAEPPDAWSTAEPRAQGPRARLGRAVRRLNVEQKLAGLAALGIVVSLLAPWWRDPVFGLSYMALNRFGWIELALLLVAAAVLVGLLRRGEARVFHLPLSDGTLAAGAGLWCCVLLLARALGPPTRDVGNRHLDYDPRWGVLLCLISATVLAVAGILERQRHHRGEPEALAADEDAVAGFVDRQATLPPLP